MADGINRRGSIMQNGGYRSNHNKFFPVFDFSDKEVAELVAAHKIKVPYDYAIWGRTFDGPQYRFIKDLKRELPEDYEKIKAAFPLIDAVMLRYSVARSEKMILDETDFLYI
jgi:3'-phosphoadenosine 5'-phosphosulfate sulfotransferase (PAPS reductase)/FAD synthetase